MLTNRFQLFLIQSILAILSIVLIGFLLVQTVDLENYNLLKIILSPFSSILLLFFLLFVFNKIARTFGDEEYDIIFIGIGFAILLATSLLTSAGINFIIGFLQSIDKIIFILSMLLCLIIFFLLRVGNIFTMAIITGIAQGVIVFVLFFY